VQLKFSALQNGEKYGGLTIPTEGVGGSWIVKLPSQQFSGVPENEFSMMTLAGLVGMDVPDLELIDLDRIEGLPEGVGELRGQAMAIRRFDRNAEGSIHMEDFAQIFDLYPDDKYEKATYRTIAKVIGIEVGDAGVAEFVRRLVFSTLIGNADMHLKNWSVLYPDRVTPVLSPAYDLLSTIPYLPDDKAALKYSRTKLMAELSVDELKHLAAGARLSEKLVLDVARETVDRFKHAWAAEKTNLPLARDVVEAVDAFAPPSHFTETPDAFLPARRWRRRTLLTARPQRRTPHPSPAAERRWRISISQSSAAIGVSVTGAGGRGPPPPLGRPPYPFPTRASGGVGSRCGSPIFRLGSSGQARSGGSSLRRRTRPMSMMNRERFSWAVSRWSPSSLARVM
jgi:hypothetical protein